MDEFDLDGADSTSTSLTDATRVHETTASDLPAAPSGDTPSPFASRMTKRMRVLRMTGIGVLLVLALAIPVGTLPSTQRVVTTLLHPRTPTATPLYPPGVQPILYSNGVPWGVLRIDGHAGIKLTGVAIQSGNGTFPPVFKLGLGRHTIMYDAPPYPPLRCTLSVPAAPSDTCPPGGGRSLDLQASPEHLSAPLANALKLAAQAALDTALMAGPGAAVTVEVGEHYLGADGQPLTATVPLRANLRYSINADPALALNPGFAAPSQCVTLCAVSSQLIVSASQDQIIGANVVVSWQYLAADDQHVVLNQAPTAPAHQYQTLTMLHVRWAGDHWLAELDDGSDTAIVSVRQTQPVCQVAGQYLGSLLGVHRVLGQSWELPTSPWPAAGCVQFTTPTTGTQSPTGSRLLLLFRLGVLLAANDATHQAFLELPVATPAEQALARQFAPG